VNESPGWDPQQYLKFADDRGRPFADLLARVAVPHARAVVDLGCGPGNATATLADRWPEAHVYGIDADPAMVEAAGQLAGPRLSFAREDVRAWRPEQPVDVIVSNAALQWVPGHQDLLPGWVAALRPGGVLAFQVPRMSGSPAGRVFGEVAGDPRWRDRLAGITAPTVAATDNGIVRPTDEYVALLTGLGCRVDAWETRYYHVLAGEDPVLEWFSGTGLRPYLSALEPDARDQFRAAVAARLREEYPRRPFGTVLPFLRCFVVAYRTEA
jgi:trans-aconitate 2-methyltransferase